MPKGFHAQITADCPAEEGEGKQHLFRDAPFPFHRPALVYTIDEEGDEGHNGQYSQIYTQIHTLVQLAKLCAVGTVRDCLVQMLRGNIFRKLKVGYRTRYL